MKRTAKDRREYLPRPVKKIELNARHMKMRLALALILLIFGIGMIFYSINERSRAQAGWTEIEANAQEASCAADFTFLYPLGTTASPAAESKALTSLYTDACVDAYRIFTNDLSYDGIHNMYDLNRHPNETLEVDAALYAALEQIQKSGSRLLYLAPLYEIYDNVFYCADVSQTAYFDPRQDESLRDWFAKVCTYAGDPSQVDIKLLGEGRVRLEVSEDYLAFAGAEEIVSFIDLYWMRNAFIVDYLAARLKEGGYAAGTLSSFDGFLRNLDAAGGTDYSLTLYDRTEEVIRQAGVLHYSGERSFVCLRNYPLNKTLLRRYCVLSANEIRTPFLDVRDGLCKSAVNDLTSYSETAGCAEILLRLIPVYITEEFRREALLDLADEGIESICCQDGVILHTQETAKLSDLYEGEDARYTEQTLSRF